MHHANMEKWYVIFLKHRTMYVHKGCSEMAQPMEILELSKYTRSGNGKRFI